MPANEMHEPDQAVQRWKDQIEENRRLEHVIADKDAEYANLLRIHDAAMFEANRLKTLNEIMRAENSFYVRRNAQLEAVLQAIGRQTADIAPLLTSLSVAATETLTAEPPRAPDVAPEPETKSPSIADEEIEVPMFLTKDGAEHRTQVPAMQGIMS